MDISYVKETLLNLKEKLLNKQQDVNQSSKELEFIVRHTTSKGKYKRAADDLNEDYKYVDKVNNFYIVADGVGGHNHGDEASRKATEDLAYNITKLIPSLKNPYFSNEKKIQTELEFLIKNTNSYIYNLSDLHRFRDFKTTIALVLLHKEKAYVSNVGDSRVYLHRNNDLKLLTQDDKDIEFNEELTSDEQLIKNRNVPITQCIGLKNVEIHSSIIDLLPEDKILMVTDGITDYVHEDEIKNILRTSSFEDVCKKINYLADNPNQMLNLMAKYRTETLKETMNYIRKKERGDNRTIITIYAREAGKNEQK